MTPAEAWAEAQKTLPPEELARISKSVDPNGQYNPGKGTQWDVNSAVKKFLSLDDAGRGNFINSWDQASLGGGPPNAGAALQQALRAEMGKDQFDKWYAGVQNRQGSNVMAAPFSAAAGGPPTGAARGGAKLTRDPGAFTNEGGGPDPGGSPVEYLLRSMAGMGSRMGPGPTGGSRPGGAGPYPGAPMGSRGVPGPGGYTVAPGPTGGWQRGNPGSQKPTGSGIGTNPPPFQTGPGQGGTNPGPPAPGGEFRPNPATWNGMPLRGFDPSYLIAQMRQHFGGGGGAGQYYNVMQGPTNPWSGGNNSQVWSNIYQQYPYGYQPRNQNA